MLRKVVPMKSSLLTLSLCKGVWGGGCKVESVVGGCEGMWWGERNLLVLHLEPQPLTHGRELREIHANDTNEEGVAIMGGAN